MALDLLPLKLFSRKDGRLLYLLLNQLSLLSMFLYVLLFADLVESYIEVLRAQKLFISNLVRLFFLTIRWSP